MRSDKDLLVVLTVGSLSQKNLCEKVISQLDLTVKNIEVICDDDLGARIGSGGALLKTVEQYYNIYPRMIVVNCGGFSKRSVNCSVKGKAFAQSLVSGKPVTIFERILDNSLRLADRFSHGVLITCSDILVDTADISPDFNNNIIFGISDNVETASHHGAMTTDSDCSLIDFLHKVEPSVLRQFIPQDCDSILVDTGMAFLCDSFVQQLLKLNREEHFTDFIKNNGIEFNFYADILPLLSKNIDWHNYIGESENSKTIELKSKLFAGFKNCSAKVYVADGQQFLHFGNSEQLRDNTILISDRTENHLEINSYINPTGKIGKGSVFDNVCFMQPCETGSGCLVSDIKFNSPVKIKSNSLVCGFRLDDGSYVTVVTDIKENPKELTNSLEIWSVPRFYKAANFDTSFKKLTTQADEDKFSLEYCVKHADYTYFQENAQYISGLKSTSIPTRYADMRLSIINRYFEGRSFPEVFTVKKNECEVSMPVRVNLSGTWTDAMPFCIENGGRVINAAVTIDGMLPITVKLERCRNSSIEFCSDNIKSDFSFGNERDEDDFSDFNLHKAVLKTVGINSSSQLSEGFRLSTNVKKIDKGSGLGTSSILLSACFRAFSEMFGLNYTNDDIMEMVFVAEQIMKTGGGWQDQAGGLFPGVKAASTLPGIPQKVQTQAIELSETIRRIFSERAVLMPTGQRHYGRFIVSDVADRYLNKNDEAISAYRKMEELNDAVLKAIENDDEIGFLNCINLHRQLLNSISPLTCNKKIECIIQKCFEAADAVSICGAGGGGYLLIFLKDSFSVDDFKAFASRVFPEIKSEILKIDIFSQGDDDE